MTYSLALNMVVYNEAHRIAETLERILPLVDEAVVIDQSSTDGTAEICAALGVTVIQDVHHGYCEPSRQKALDATQASWVLVMDADEYVTDEFAQDLRTLDKYPQVRIKIGFRIAGEYFCIGGPVYRIFPKADFYCWDLIHTCPVPYTVLTPSMGLRVLPYVAMWNEKKSWAEYLRSLERNEKYGRGNFDFLKLARKHEVTGAELDAMTQEHRHRLGFRPGVVY